VTNWENATNPESLNDTLSVLMDNIEANGCLGANKTAATDLKANIIFNMMGEYLAQGNGKDLPAKVGAIF